MYARVLSSLALLGLLPAIAGCEFRFEKRPGPVAPADAQVPAASTPSNLCTSDDPASILGCERAKYGQMDEDQIAQFLKDSATALNRNGIGGGPYGVLRKANGWTCGGYSCDIICAEQGTSQRQYDVLIGADGAQVVIWGEALTYPNIRVDTCDIQ